MQFCRDRTSSSAAERVSPSLWAVQDHGRDGTGAPSIPVGQGYVAVMDVHLLQHIRHARNLDGSPIEHRDAAGELNFDERHDDVKIVGICSSSEAAQNGISRTPANLPAFRKSLTASSSTRTRWMTTAGPTALCPSRSAVRTNRCRFGSVRWHESQDKTDAGTPSVAAGCASGRRHYCRDD